MTKYTVVGTDEYGRPKEEMIEVDQRWRTRLRLWLQALFWRPKITTKIVIR